MWDPFCFLLWWLSKSQETLDFARVYVIIYY